MNSLFSGVQTDIFALVILTIIFSKNILQSHKQCNKFFNLFVVSTGIVLVFDACVYIFNARSVMLNMIFNTAGYIFTPIVPFMGMMYLEFRLFKNHSKLKYLIYIVSTAILIYIVICFYNINSTVLFYIDKSGVYHRGKYFYILEVLSALICLIPVVKTLFTIGNISDKQELKDIFKIYIYLLPILIGVILQFFVYGVSTNWLGTTVSILLFFIDWQESALSTDPLTEVNNWRELYRYLNWKLSTLNSNERLFAFVIDADNFKAINDTYGHEEGNKALFNIAEVLKTACTKKNDFLARMGGDEFAIVCTRRKDDNVDSLVKNINIGINEFNNNSGKNYMISLSIGISEYDKDKINTIDELIKIADNRMYASKNEKKIIAG